MTWVRCATCRARRPVSMPACPVCDGPAGAAPRFDELERRERAAWHRVELQLFVAEFVLLLVFSLVDWLLGGCG